MKKEKELNTELSSETNTKKIRKTKNNKSEISQIGLEINLETNLEPENKPKKVTEKSTKSDSKVSEKAEKKPRTSKTTKSKKKAEATEIPELTEEKKSFDNNKEFEKYLFKQGTNYQSYKYLGAHPEGELYCFRVWAPSADNVCLVGDFYDWENGVQMNCCDGIWTVELPRESVKTGMKYKFLIWRGGRKIYKSDPYAFYSEMAYPGASIVFDVLDKEAFKWDDAEYLEGRKKLSEPLSQYKSPKVPMNIYEVHLGSWKRRDDGSYMNYREIAHELPAYVKSMGYTHVEFLPVAEHPFDGSWGYQVCGYYAPTCRYGTPTDFMYLVNQLHLAGIGVILDWVPAHFPKDEYGLFEFDGSCLYEYQGDTRKEFKGWGTRAFDVGRTEVQSFLVSNALYWLKEYHIDGLRVDAVSAMLYLDYCREAGEWQPNYYGGNYSLEAIAFFKKLNGVIREEVPDALMIAEESTSFPGLTSKDGLGFSMKWNMGWMNDTLSYVKTDSVFKKHVHNKMSFSLMYAFSENYILPISHDEVVHGKGSLVNKMFGDYWQKFACSRTYLAYMLSHPGKKLTFMGCEYAPFREWDYSNSLEWFMLSYDMHRKYQSYIRELNFFYLEHKEFWEIEDSFDGFHWISADDNCGNIYAYSRKDSDGNNVYVVLNFSPNPNYGYCIPVDEDGEYEILLNSDDECFGGSGAVKVKDLWAENNKIITNIPPLAGVYIAKKRNIIADI